MKEPEAPQTGYYFDGRRTWFCVSDKERRMVCNSLGGEFTAASFEVFRRWGWKPCDSSIKHNATHR